MAKAKTKPLSWDSIKDLVRTKLNEGRGRDQYGSVVQGAWIREIWDGEVVYTDDSDGKSYRRSWTLADNFQVELGAPELVVEVRSFEPLKFSADLSAFSEGKDLVSYTGKVFELGEYPDKGFSLTETEADAAIAAFAPVPNDLEHKPTVLDGQLGGLKKLWRQGKELFGQVDVPKWLHEATGGGPLKTSLAFDAGTKQVVGNALVLNPRIPDATLVAAFNESRHEPPKTTAPKEVRMSLLAKVQALFSSGKTPTEEELKAVVAPEFKAPDPTPAPPAPEPDPTVFSELAQLKAARVSDAATAFAKEAVGAGKVVPAQEEALVALFRAAVEADAKGKPVAFSAEGRLVEGENLKALRAFVDGLPSRKLDPAASFSLLGAKEGDPPYAPIAIDLKEVNK